MAQTQKTITKTASKVAVKAPAKPVYKAARKAKAAPKTAPVAAVNIAHKAAIEFVAAAIAGGSRFYATAIAYHKGKGTTFPRPRNAARIAALTVEDVEEVKRQHDARILASGNGAGQACFDIYMSYKK